MMNTKINHSRSQELHKRNQPLIKIGTRNMILAFTYITCLLWWSAIWHAGILWKILSCLLIAGILFLPPSAASQKRLKVSVRLLNPLTAATCHVDTTAPNDQNHPAYIYTCPVDTTAPNDQNHPAYIYIYVPCRYHCSERSESPCIYIYIYTHTHFFISVGCGASPHTWDA